MAQPRCLSSAFQPDRDELIDLLGRLVAARTENPPGNETAAAIVAADYFTRCGIPFGTHEFAPGRANVVARVGAGKPELLIAAHLDVVPPGDGWDTDPFRLEVKGDWLIGRGVSDNKGPLACLLLAARFLHEYVPLKGTVLAAAVADEERGSGVGLERLLDERVIAPDVALIPDVAGLHGIIDVAEKGVLFVEIVTHGRQAHGSRPELGVNAAAVLVDFLHRLRQRPVPIATHPLFTPTTMNLGSIHGGAAPNMVPARCTAALDIRFLPGQTREQMLAHLEAVAAEVRRDHPQARLDVHPMACMAPTETPPDHPLVTCLRQAVFEATQQTPELVGFAGATVTKQLATRGIPAVAFGPGHEDQAHAANERIEVAELLRHARVLALAAEKLLGVQP